jgi:hypothetical protein
VKGDGVAPPAFRVVEAIQPIAARAAQTVIRLGDGFQVRSTQRERIQMKWRASSIDVVDGARTVQRPGTVSSTATPGGGINISYESMVLTISARIHLTISNDLL